MQRLRFTGGRVAGVLAAMTMLGGALALGASAVSADTGTFPLLPVPGASSFGGGSVTNTPGAGITQVQIDLTGARVGNVYNVSVCTNTGVSFACISGGTIMTDFTGSFHGPVVVATAQVDLVSLVNSADGTDAYQAATGSTPVTTQPVRGVDPVFPDPSGTGGFSGPTLPSMVVPGSAFSVTGVQVMPDGTLMLPANSTSLAVMFCPPGFSGPLMVPNPQDPSQLLLITC